MDAAKSFRSNFSYLIQRAQTNPSAFAKSAGLSGPLVYAYLSGKNVPGLEQLEKIASALGVSVATLIGDDPPKSSPPRRPTPEEMALAVLSALKLPKEKEKAIRAILLETP